MSKKMTNFDFFSFTFLVKFVYNIKNRKDRNDLATGNYLFYLRYTQKCMLIYILAC